MINKRIIFDIHRLKDEGYSDRVIARRLGIGRKSVRKYLENPTLEHGCSQHVSKLEPFKDRIDALLKEEPTLSGEIIRQQIVKAGYDGSKTILYEYLKEHRPRIERAYTRFESEPGEQFQIDWGELGCLHYGSIRRKIYCMAISECHSRMSYIELAHSQNQACVHQSILNAFRFFNGSPKEIVTDNMLTAVIDRDGPLIRFNDAFLEFLRPFHVIPKPCHVRAPHEKGKIEKGGIGYIKQNFWPLRKAENLEDLQQQLNRWRDEIANVRVHGTTGERPIVRFDPLALRALPEFLPDCREIRCLKVHKDFCVNFDCNTYTVPPWLVGKHIILKADNRTIELFYNENRVARHQRCWEKHRRIEIEAHRIEALKHRSSHSVSDEVALIMSLGDPIKAYLEKLVEHQNSIRKSAQQLIQFKRDYGLQALCEAIDRATAHHAYGLDYIENILNQKPIVPQPPVILKQEHLNRIYLSEPMLEDYDTLILKRRSLHERCPQR